MADRLLLTLEYLREYRTYFHIAGSYGISESACCRTVHWLEKTLIASGVFHLPGRKALLGNAAASEVFLVDATESPVERPKKQRRCYSGKKKRHTLKTRVVVNKASRQIIRTHMAPGRRHDRKLFTCSGVRFRETAEVIADSGYQGLRNEHANTSLPTKKPKKQPLTREQKRANRERSRKRILIENVMGFLKCLKIIDDRYRNRHRRFGVRFNLIAAIYNMELANPA